MNQKTEFQSPFACHPAATFFLASLPRCLWALDVLVQLLYLVLSTQHSYRLYLKQSWGFAFITVRYKKDLCSMLRIPCICVYKHKYWEDNLLQFQISKPKHSLGSVTPLAIEFWSSLQYQFFLWKKKFSYLTEYTVEPIVKGILQHSPLYKCTMFSLFVHYSMYSWPDSIF